MRTAKADAHAAGCSVDGVDCCLVTQITGNGLSRKSLFSQEGKFLYGSELPPDAEGDIRQRIIQARFPHEPVYMQAGPENFILEFIQSQPHLIIFGGGHVGRAVSQCASIAGFRVTVVDDRHPFANKQRFPEAFSVLCENFVESFKRLTITPSTFVVIVTRGHRHDEEVLEQILRFSPKYIGMIGSKRKVTTIYDHLTAKGIPPDRLAGVHAPVGLNIGAVTADEIGVSITAELVAARRNVLNSIDPAVSMRLIYSRSTG